MTFLEKLKIEHPERISETCLAGVVGCPYHYKYEPVPYCAHIDEDCTACWNREMPEAETEKKREELCVWCENSKCEECPIYKIVDFAEVCDFESMPKERLDELYEAIRTAKKKTEPEAHAIKDSGNRREFETGAVRDIQEGKGRMDLLPWAAIIEVSKHCENGAKKYGEHNVEKGIPLHSLCDSAARHFAKFMDGQTDEDHLLAATWNLLWAVEMRLKKPEMCDVPWKEAEK